MRKTRRTSDEFCRKIDGCSFINIYFVTALLFIFDVFVFTSSVMASKSFGPEGRVPLVYCGPADAKPILIVSKAEHRLYVLGPKKEQFEKRGNLDQWEIYASFSVLLGANKGDKLKIGDRRTPEGLYHIKKWIPKKELDSHYGAGAFTLDYPNQQDRILGKSGNGIWIHGKAPDRSDNETTLGCIVLDNKNLCALRYWVKPGTMVLITPQLRWGTQTKRMEIRNEWRDRVVSWQNAWEQGDIEAFSKFYHHDFPGRKNFLFHKKAIWTRSPARTLYAEPIAIFLENESEATTVFRQLYLAQNIEGWGQRILFWKRRMDGTFAIIAQTWEKDNSCTWHSVSPDSSIHYFLRRWQTAWESQDLVTYAKCYHPRFSSDHGDVVAWIIRKHQIWAKGPLTIDIRDAKMTLVGQDTWIVSFRQIYQQGRQKDIGHKTLALRQGPSGLQIYREFWQVI